MTVAVSNVDWQKCDGLLPAIVQDSTSGRVLMLGYMNAEALEATLAGGLVTFFSRTRQCLWVKGESSGNSLAVRDVRLDCDADTLLVIADPAGPTCHTGKTTCFDSNSNAAIAGFAGTLETIIDQRINASDDSSYVASLIGAGNKKIAQKVGEEAVEVALASTTGDSEHLIEETADLLFHTLVLLRSHDLGLLDVLAELERRHRRATQP